MPPKRLEPGDRRHRDRVRYHVRAALDATDTAEKQYHIREALQLLSIEDR